MSKKIFSFVVLLCFLINNSVYSQSGNQFATVKGRTVNAATGAPLGNIQVSITGVKETSNSDADGNFSFANIPFGNQTINFEGKNLNAASLSIVVNSEMINLNDINLNTKDENTTFDNNVEIPTITIEDNSESNTNADVSAMSTGGNTAGNRDDFLRTVNNLAIYHNFQPRGYKRNTRDIQINGIPMNDIESGSAVWGLMGGLNDVFHSTNVTYGLSPSNYTFGGINGFTYVAGTAMDQREGTNISYSNTNMGSYNNNLRITKSTGLMKNGWAFSVSFSKRWSEKGYVPGTYFDGYSYYAAATKVLGKGQLSITTFGAPTIRGKSHMATMEAYNLAGTNYYNDAWGKMPDGSVRNAYVQNVYQPVTIANYEYKPNEKTRWNNAIAYEFGKDKNSRLSGYNYDPAVIGDYYKNLPNYYYTLYPPDSATGKKVRDQILAKPELLQLNWNRMYQSNYLNTQTMYNVNGVAGNTFTGRQSTYIIANDVKDLKKFTFNSNVEHTFSGRFSASGGLTFVMEQTENYDQVADLLGGDYFVNFNNFASQQYIGNPNYNQNNLNKPNAVIKSGDKFGFDYALHSTDATLWGQAIYNVNKFDFFVAANGGFTSYFREGYMRNGLFANNSYGTSATHSFATYGVKGGVSYELDKRNYLYLNAAFTTQPPASINTYISARTRDFTINSPTVYNFQSMEGGYFMRYPKTVLRITGYVTDMTKYAEILRFYNDDPAYNTFVNYVVSGQNVRHIGVEFAADHKLSSSFSLKAFASVGQSFYTNDPNVTVYLDNDTTQHATTDKTYIKNYYVASTGPQTIGVIGLKYNARKGYHVELDCNYMDRNYVTVNPNRRTQTAAGIVPEGSAKWHQIFDQEELPSAVTVDLSAGKSFQIGRTKFVKRFLPGSSLYVSGNIDNLLNNTNVINTGSEQLRYDYLYSNPNKFQSRYMYGRAITYRISVNLRF